MIANKSRDPFSVLGEIIEAIASSFDVDQALDALVSHVARAFGAQAVSVLLLSRKAEGLEVRASMGDVPDPGSYRGLVG